MYFNNNDDERNKLNPGNWSHLSTRDHLDGMLSGKLPVQRNQYDVNKGKSPYYYLDEDGNEYDRPVGAAGGFSAGNTGQPQNTNYGTGTVQNGIENRFNNTASTPQAGVFDGNQNANTKGVLYDTLRKGEQLASAGLNGLTLGLNDEIEGVLGGLGYGVANLGMKGLNKLGFNVRAPEESAWEAAQRGYVKSRDERRQALNNGYKEMPIASVAMESIGSMASNPYGRVFAASKAMPLAMKAARRGYATLANSLTSGVGNVVENTPLEYAKNLAQGGLSAAAGNRVGNTLFGRGDHSQLGRSVINEVANRGVQFLHDATRLGGAKEEDEEERQWRQRNGMGYY